jgi:hypothetical protein
VWAAKAADTRASRPAPEAASGHYVEALVQESVSPRGDTVDWVDMSGAFMPLAANIAPGSAESAQNGDRRLVYSDSIEGTV